MIHKIEEDVMAETEWAVLSAQALEAESRLGAKLSEPPLSYTAPFSWRRRNASTNYPTAPRIPV